MYLCRELTDLTLPKIGQTFGGRDHTTVMHAAKKIRNELAERRQTYDHVQELTARIRSAPATRTDRARIARPRRRPAPSARYRCGRPRPDATAMRPGRRRGRPSARMAAARAEGLVLARCDALSGPTVRRDHATGGRRRMPLGERHPARRAACVTNAVTHRCPGCAARGSREFPAPRSGRSGRAALTQRPRFHPHLGTTLWIAHLCRWTAAAESVDNRCPARGQVPARPLRPPPRRGAHRPSPADVHTAPHPPTCDDSRPSTLSTGRLVLLLDLSST